MPRVRLRIDGMTYEDEVEPRLLLVHYLRDVAGRTGTPIGCDTSTCGACTVRLDGKAVKSCSVFAVQADGGEVVTIQGLARGPLDAAGDRSAWHPMQRAFSEQHGLQCGYCTPGMILAAIDFLEENPQPSDEEIRHGLEGNLCRCTGYQNIVKAVSAAAAEMRAATGPDDGDSAAAARTTAVEPGQPGSREGVSA